jgi:hypothetical protein
MISSFSTRSCDDLSSSREHLLRVDIEGIASFTLQTIADAGYILLALFSFENEEKSPLSFCFVLVCM